MLYTFLTLTLLVFGARMIERVTGWPLYLCALLSGLVSSLAIAYWQLDSGLRAAQIQSLVSVFLLPLVMFYSGWQLGRHHASATLRLTLLCIASSAVFTLLGVTMLLYWLIGHPQGFPVASAFVCAVMLLALEASTSASWWQRFPTLARVCEQEAIGCDLLVILTVSLWLLPNTTSSLNNIATLIAIAAIVGGSIGALAAALLTTAIRPAAVMLAAVTSTIMISELLQSGSASFSCVIAAFVINRFQRSHNDFIAIHDLNRFGQACLYGLLGLLLTVEMFQERYLAMIIAIAACILCRLISARVLRLIPMSKQLSHQEWWLLGLSGHRGMVAISLVLLLPLELAGWWTIQSMVFAVVLSSIVIQQPLIAWFSRK